MGADASDDKTILGSLPARLALVGVGLAVSWYGMMAAHEFGHVLHAWLSGGRVQRVVVPFLGFSRTDVSPNPHPLFVAWGGAMWGVLIPLGAWAGGRRLRRIEWALAFFAGFCLIANGAYLGAGAFMPVGDAEELVAHGTPRWVLAGFGAVACTAGLWLWHRGRSDRPRSSAGHQT